MSEACLKQIRYWDKALKDSQKGHIRKNRKIHSMKLKLIDQEKTIRELMKYIAVLELKEKSQ